MSGTLRPMSLGEILDRTFQIYRARVLLFAAVGALSASSSLVVVLVFRYVWPVMNLVANGLELSPSVSQYLSSWFNAHFTMAFHAVLFPIYISCASGMVFGSEVSLRRGFAVVRARWRTYAWLGALKILLQMVIPEALLVGLLAIVGLVADRVSYESLLFNATMWVSVGACGVFAYYVVLWLWPRLAFSFPACVTEALPAKAAVRRSFRLARDRRWSVVLVWATLWVANSLVWVLLRYALWRIAFLLFQGHMFEPAPHRFFLISLYGVWGIFAALLAPIYPIAVTLLYYDQRIRKEGFDIEWMMQAAGMEQAAGDAATAPAESAAGEDASVPVEEAGA